MTELVVRAVPVDRVGALAARFVESRRSQNTRRKYAEHLDTWLVWCRASGVDPLEARHAHVLAWLVFREQQGDSDSTRATRLAAVSSWYRYLLRERVVPHNPADLHPEERPKFNPRHTPALSPNQAERLLQAADAHTFRTSALVALMLFTGARIGELLGADVADIGQDAGHPVLRIMGKGRKRRDLPLIPAVYVRLRRYLDSRDDMTLLPALPGQVSAGSPPLLATSRGRRVDPKQARRLLMLCAERAGLEPEVIAALTLHSTRATYATSSLAAGIPLRDVQYALGHEDPRTTEGYDRSSLSRDRHPSYLLAQIIRTDEIV